MRDLATFLPIWKTKKETIALWFDLGYLQFNHPHRLDTVEMSGTLSYTIDQRNFSPEPATSATKYEFSLDFADHPAYSRQWITKVPWLGNSPITLSNGEFILGHHPLRVWEILDEVQSYISTTIIGTVTITPYTRDTDEDPWDEGTPADHDISLLFDFFLAETGGDPDSGGKDGSTDAEITLQFTWSGTSSGLLPNFDGSANRAPWTDPWADEELSSIFTTHLSDANSDDGGGHSGSCTAKVEFVSAP